MRQSPLAQAGELYRLEELSNGDTVIHRRHPAAKLLGTLLYLICFMSFDRYALGQLTPFLLYPVTVIALGEIPWGIIGKRTAVTLPFCLFAALSGLMLDRQVLYTLGGIPVTGGMLSCCGILLRTLLCVASVLLLVAVTPMRELTGQLRRMHVPGLLVNLFEMTYRYAGTLLEEAGSMSTAYHLRAPGKKGLEMRHMGAFLGGLLLKSYHRAQRVYHAMVLRGYGGVWSIGEVRAMDAGDWLYLLLVGGGAVLLRWIDVPALLGRGITCWM